MSTLEIISAVSQIVASAVTVVTPFLVWKELRNVQNNQHAATTQAIADSERELWSTVLENKDMTKVLTKHLGLGDKVLEHRAITHEQALILLLFIRQYENIYYQYKKGMLPDGLWEHWAKSMKNTFEEPGIQQIFYKARIGYSDEFIKFIKKEIISKQSDKV